MIGGDRFGEEAKGEVWRPEYDQRDIEKPIRKKDMAMPMRTSGRRVLKYRCKNKGNSRIELVCFGSEGDIGIKL